MGRLARYWCHLRETFWFLPGAIVAGATLLAFAAIEADARFVASGALEAWPRMFGAGPSASRSLLTAIAGSMITVAGTVFSITLVALSLASSQYSSRVLRNFMRDRTNQSVLGTFLGIFAYCLVVLRSIYGTGEDAFVPSVAVLLGLLLGFGGIGVLVFFIHHIARSIQASQILDAVRGETCAVADRLFPENAGVCSIRDSSSTGMQWHDVLRASAPGYVQFIDYPRLRANAREHNVRFYVHPRIGQYVLEDDLLLSVSELSAPKFVAADDCLAIGAQRSLEQDVGFGIRQVVDVALKALSPGINDTTTAVMCIDTLTAILARLASRELRYEGCAQEDVPWVDARHPLYEDLLDEAFDQIRYAARYNVAILERLCWALCALRTKTGVPERLRALRVHGERLQETVQRHVEESHEFNRLVRSTDAILQELRSSG
ncbi:DUF2254 domain-containing protein [Noviluteimonas gilva]|uniref:DUF2254 domain-containing protein n=1 Tax=Noviluteimonas gilva TaxID=2682097 RepID=A0A7C9LH88_9GAMM|nr:DUF2254 domain-containing protein [Lysobacter gilvus]MUV14701.1 DUF2254 domain-containing protein [Lysobacter gilvus]